MKDIKQLPFEDFFATYSNLWTARAEQAKKMATDLAQRQYNKIKASAVNIARKSLDSEAGSDGLEEDFDEGHGFDPSSVEIPEDEVYTIKEQCKVIAYEKFVKEYGLEQAHTWFPYQLLSYFGSWKPVLGSDGLFSSELTRAENVRNKYDAGLYHFALGSISPLFKGSPREFKQYNSPICPLVPIILAGMKQNQNVQYNSWSREGIDILVAKPLAEAMLCEVPEVSTEELMSIRTTALTGMTGNSAGSYDDSATSIKLNRVNESILREVPKLAKYMLLQTWCAHPSNRNKNSVLDPSDWDNIPDALINTEPVIKQYKKLSTKSTTLDKAPWEI